MYFQQPSGRNQQPKRNNLIKVTGEGEMTVQPDTATINLGVVTEEKELIPAQQQNSVIGTKIIDSLTQLGIGKSQIQTFDYRIEPNYDYEQGKQVFRGYKVTHILQVKLDDLSIVGKVVDTAVQNGANYVADIVFTTKQKEAFYNQALALALNNASNKAATIANTMRVTLVATPILVTEVGSPIQPFETKQMTFAATSTPIQPGQLIIKATITADFSYV